MAPITQRIHIAHVKALLKANCNVAHATGNFPGYKRFATAWAFMVKQNAITGIHAITFTIVHGNPVGVHFCHRIGAARVKRRGFLLWNFLHQTIQLGSTGLVKAGLLFKTQKSNCFQQAQRSHGINIRCVLRCFETNCDMALRTQVIHLVRLYFLNDSGQVR